MFFPGLFHLSSSGGPRGGGEAPGGGGVAGSARQRGPGASAAKQLWISVLGASLLASLVGKPEFKMQIIR